MRMVKSAEAPVHKFAHGNEISMILIIAEFEKFRLCHARPRFDGNSMALIA